MQFVAVLMTSNNLKKGVFSCLVIVRKWFGMVTVQCKLKCCPQRNCKKVDHDEKAGLVMIKEDLNSMAASGSPLLCHM